MTSVVKQILRPKYGELASKHSELAARLPRGARIAYLDYPTHNNTGDLLIFLGTMEFFRRAGWNVVYSATLDNFNIEHLRRQRFDAIIMHGGGNFGDIYKFHQELREMIAYAFPDTPIIIFPQSIHFTDAELKTKSMDSLSAAHDLSLYTRDTRSFAIATETAEISSHLAPDMAHNLWEWFADLRAIPGDGTTLLHIRRDVEATPVPSPLLARKAEFVDWPQINGSRLRIQNGLFRKTEILERKLGINLSTTSLFETSCRSVVKSVARRMNRHDVWITSRLHTVILGCLLDKYVFFIDNSYGKLSTYVSTWAENFNPIGIIDSEASATEALAFSASVKANRDGAQERYRALACVR
ncbi:polysaccharide pyruvyl transferase family protein [Ancylobacter sp. 6x-1]|uniref:Polysaccharide pyruvyl transferase family protein n=1 Tax=Ancylobacter crimeensis TaxID=2579147 RepID=A0ABT0D6N2_9HYPH|nr:polysaccharide pyruvyl transferase family protein [Ancylobacter crimeensis]MCK0195609.1 polysaccharide pyruvyl transferase family protein [Ancylobacter crimeensis]